MIRVNQDDYHSHCSMGVLLFVKVMDALLLIGNLFKMTLEKGGGGCFILACRILPSHTSFFRSMVKT